MWILQAFPTSFFDVERLISFSGRNRSMSDVPFILCNGARSSLLLPSRL